jgi:hypothetical protein
MVTIFTVSFEFASALSSIITYAMTGEKIIMQLTTGHLVNLISRAARIYSPNCGLGIMNLDQDIQAERAFT